MSAKILMNESASKSIGDSIDREYLKDVVDELAEMSREELDSAPFAGTQAEATGTPWKFVPLLNGQYVAIVRPLTREEAVDHAGVEPADADQPVYLVAAVARVHEVAASA